MPGRNDMTVSRHFCQYVISSGDIDLSDSPRNTLSAPKANIPAAKDQRAIERRSCQVTNTANVPLKMAATKARVTVMCTFGARKTVRSFEKGLSGDGF